jgi:hypothetical protein
MGEKARIGGRLGIIYQIYPRSFKTAFMTA